MIDVESPDDFQVQVMKDDLRTIRCSLAAHPLSEFWPSKAKKYFRDCTTNQTFRMEKVDKISSVDLVDDNGESVRYLLFANDLAHFDQRNFSVPSRQYKGSFLDLMPASISWGNSPNDFYVILKEVPFSEDDIEISRSLSAEWRKGMKFPVKTLLEGQYVLLTVKNKLSRGKILKLLSEDLAQVELLDRGTLKMKAKKDLFQVTCPSFFIHEARAFKCQLAFLKPPEKYGWHTQAIRDFRSLCLRDEEVKVQFVNDVNQVKIFVGSTYVNEYLVAKGFAEWIIKPPLVQDYVPLHEQEYLQY